MTALVNESPATASTGIQELGQIIAAYSEVTEKLQLSHIQLQQTVESLRSDLAEKNRELERRNRLAALGEMAAGMAHEIRNPLGGIQLYTSLLAKDVKDLPDSLKLVKKISSGVRHLESLVSQVLQFTREITATRIDANLADIVEQSVELASAACGAKNISCQLSGPRPCLVSVDALLLGQALLNLLLNAAEAIDGVGTIHVSWSRSQNDRSFQIEVRDSGSGIAPHILDRLFNPFFTTKETGTGLGLAIVHRIVEAHDGTIKVDNGPHGGARFEIRI